MIKNARENRPNYFFVILAVYRMSYQIPQKEMICYLNSRLRPLQLLEQRINPYQDIFVINRMDRWIPPHRQRSPLPFPNPDDGKGRGRTMGGNRQKALD